jgi:predicted acylesterase/phospholipase RssA
MVDCDVRRGGKPGSNRRGPNGKFAGPSIWLSMSGGGFRAAIFHYGCLKRLQELGLLAHVYAYSAASGGSIIAALLHMHSGESYIDTEKNIRLEKFRWEHFEQQFLQLVRRGVFGPVLLLLSAYMFYVLAATAGAAAILLRHPISFVPLTVGIPSSLFTVALVISASAIAAAVLLHTILAVLLIQEGAHKPSRLAVLFGQIDERNASAEWAHPSATRLLGMLVSLAYLRRQIMNLRAFHGQLLRSIFSKPRLYLASVDLNSGKECVFTSSLFADLSASGCRYLWDQRTDSDENSVQNVELAEAVTASSAFPPLFQPVAIRNKHGVIGVFVDGGVLDNFALNVPKSFGVWIHPRRGQRYKGELPSFREEISFILILDGCKAPSQKTKRQWSRVASVWRVKDILVDQQFDAATLYALDFDWNMGITSGIVGLEMGFPPESLLCDRAINNYLKQVRTHVDSFSLEEIATIGYCGYLWTDQAIADRLSLSDYERAEYKPLTAFEKFLPERCGTWRHSVSELRRHLQYSHRRLLLLRMIGRKFGF